MHYNYINTAKYFTMLLIAWILMVNLSVCNCKEKKLDKTNWTIQSRYHHGDFEPCDTHNCSKPPTLDHCKLTWFGDGPQHCYGNKVRYVCHCDEDTGVEDVKDDEKDAYFERWRRRIAWCQSHGGWSIIEGHENRCKQKHCDDPWVRDHSTVNVTKLIPVHPDLQTPDLKGKYCPGSTVHHICNECYSGGGHSECSESFEQYVRGGVWSQVKECKKIPGCKTCKPQVQPVLFCFAVFAQSNQYQCKAIFLSSFSACGIPWHFERIGERKILTPHGENASKKCPECSTGGVMECSDAKWIEIVPCQSKLPLCF